MQCLIQLTKNGTGDDWQINSLGNDDVCISVEKYFSL